MFSYRHAFHAGNHADVLKHITLLATLRHLMRKDAPLLLVDTHAGAGLYRLDDAAACTSGEAMRGVARLLPNNGSLSGRIDASGERAAQSPDATHALTDYLTVLASFNRAGAERLRVYPGSPMLMYALMNESARATVHDRLKLFELHPTDIQALQAHVTQLEAGRRVSVARQDGFEGLKALLPPPAGASGSRRALVLMDPSYEIKSDYAKVVHAIQDALKRFATGVYLVWYPLIARPEAHSLPRRLRTLAQQAGRSWLNASLNVGIANAGHGLSASGMFVINPPHTLQTSLRQTLPQLLHALQEPDRRGGGWTVESSDDA